MPAALRALQEIEQLEVVLVGDEAAIGRQLKSPAPKGLSIVHATQTVGMDEPPAQALRTKKDSSMRVALDIVKRGDADACVSAGNTGALWQQRALC